MRPSGRAPDQLQEDDQGDDGDRDPDDEPGHHEVQRAPSPDGRREWIVYGTTASATGGRQGCAGSQEEDA